MVNAETGEVPRFLAIVDVLRLQGRKSRSVARGLAFS